MADCAGQTRREPDDDGPGRAGTGLAATKKSVHTTGRGTEQVKSLWAAFAEAVQTKDFTRFKFVDETSTNLTYCRRYARAEGGQRAHQATPLHGGMNVTLVATLTLSGLQAAITVNGDCLCHLPAAGARPYARARRHGRARQPASPQSGRPSRMGGGPQRPPTVPAAVLARFQPHRTGLQQAKPWLRTAQARTRDALKAVIQAATEWITERDAKNGFDRCGHHVH